MSRSSCVAGFSFFLICFFLVCFFLATGFFLATCFFLPFVRGDFPAFELLLLLRRCASFWALYIWERIYECVCVCVFCKASVVLKTYRLFWLRFWAWVRRLVVPLLAFFAGVVFFLLLASNRSERLKLPPLCCEVLFFFRSANFCLRLREFTFYLNNNLSCENS